jgi:hypothetical protein
MTPAEARANADALRAKALALYAEAKALSAEQWKDSVKRAFFAKLYEAIAADDEYNAAVVIAMRLETEKRRLGSAD